MDWLELRNSLAARMAVVRREFAQRAQTISFGGSKADSAKAAILSRGFRRSRGGRMFAALLIFGSVVAAPVNSYSGPSLVLDVETGEVLHSFLPDQPWYPASLAKLMTAYIAFTALRTGEISLNSLVPISKHAASMPPSRVGFPVGSVVTMGDALKMFVVKSANDIAVAVAERIGGDVANFVKRMNHTASVLGLHSTRFTNPTGLHHRAMYTTARDVAILSRAIVLNFPEQAALFQISALKLGSRTLKSHNTLLESFRGATGLKTGYTCSAGYNISATAIRGDRHTLVVILGSVSQVARESVASTLLAFGATGFPSKRVSAGFDLYSLPFHRSTVSPYDMRPVACGKKRLPRGFFDRFKPPAGSGEVRPRSARIRNARQNSIAPVSGPLANLKNRALPSSRVDHRYVGFARSSVRLGRTLPVPRPANVTTGRSGVPRAYPDINRESVTYSGFQSSDRYRDQFIPLRHPSDEWFLQSGNPNAWKPFR